MKEAKNFIELSLKEKQILTKLSMNARESLASIAKKLNTTRQVMKYTIESLEKRGVIAGYYVILDAANLGCLYYTVQFKLKNLSEKREQEIINFLTAQKSVGWLWQEHVENDISLSLMARNVIHFDSIMKDIYSFIGTNLDYKSINIPIELCYLNCDFVNENSPRVEINLLTKEPITPNIDGTDWKLLELLSYRGRESLVQLGKDLSIAPSAVKLRINKLISLNIIKGFNLEVNYNFLGYSFHTVYIRFAYRDEKTEIELINYLKKNPNIDYITRGIGNYDLDYAIQTRSQADLNSFVKSLNWKFPGLIKDYKIQTVIMELFGSFQRGEITKKKAPKKKVKTA